MEVVFNPSRRERKSLRVNWAMSPFHPITLVYAVLSTLLEESTFAGLLKSLERHYLRW
jgi:hypothetical protein